MPVITLHMNPEPWTVDLGVARTGGKLRPYAYPSPRSKAFKEGIREALAQVPNIAMVEGPVDLRFFLWRQLPVGITDGRKLRAHVADATNLQKALEDALQGILFKNDRAVVSIHTTIVEQSQNTDPRIVIHYQRGMSEEDLRHAFIANYGEPEEAPAPPDPTSEQFDPKEFF